MVQKGCILAQLEGPRGICFMILLLCRFKNHASHGGRGALFQTHMQKYSMWWKNGLKNHELANVMRVLGALVCSRTAEWCFTRARALKKKQPPTTGKHRGATEEPPGITLSGSMPPWDAQEISNRTRTADGTREMTGSSMPWAQGPTNLVKDRVVF